MRSPKSVFGDKVKVTFQVEIRGPFALLYDFMIGWSIKKKVPIEMEQMLKKAKLLGKS